MRADGFQTLVLRNANRLTVLVLFLLLITASSFAQDPADRLDRIFAGFNKPGSPGCSVGVVRNGQLVFRRSYGKGSLELGVPLTSQSVFYLASVSKQFTAASVVLGAEQGFLSLD